jgi:hypothetical protein
LRTSKRQRIDILERRMEALEKRLDDTSSSFLTLYSSLGYNLNIRPEKIVDSIQSNEIKDYRETLVDHIKHIKL